MVHRSAGDHCSAFSYYARDFTFFNKQEREGKIYFFKAAERPFVRKEKIKRVEEYLSFLLNFNPSC